MDHAKCALNNGRDNPRASGEGSSVRPRAFTVLGQPPRERGGYYLISHFPEQLTQFSHVKVRETAPDLA